jgi:N6-adenosine-specific RNA methylase IME4
MNDAPMIIGIEPAAALAERRQKTLTRFEGHLRELAVSPPLERIAEIDRELDLIEQHARDTGLFRDHEMLEFRIGRLVARWRLGEALARVERAPGPGRGKKEPRGLGSFQHVIERNQLTWPAVQQAQRIACLPPQELEAFCARAREEAAGQLPTFAELLRSARPWWYQESRREKHRDIARRARLSNEPLGPFPLIYADPPWRFEVYSDKGLDRTPDQHYPTLSDEEIIAFKVAGKRIAEIAERDAALLLWCTSSNVHRALGVVAGWDFEFKTSAVWDKETTGLGLVFRNQHEVLLYGTRGDMPGPQYQPSSVFRYPAGEHSAKPPEVRAAIERMYPDFDARTRLELFGRGDIPGWTVYGYEAD